MCGTVLQFLLESVEGWEKIGRYNLLDCDSLWILSTESERFQGQEIGNYCTIQTHCDGSQKKFEDYPFTVLKLVNQ